MIMLVDSHCHLDLIEDHENTDTIEVILAQAKSRNVGACLTVSTSLKTFPRVLAFAEQYDSVFCSLGVHPHNDERETVSADRLCELAVCPKVVAIGETGLDYYYDNDLREHQIEQFQAHIEAANRLDKPLIIHTRQAQADTLSVMKESNASQCGGVMHCFTEDWAMAKAALDLGFYISMSGIVTFKKAEQVQEVAKKVPLDRLLVETDSPYLAPVPYRGKPNQPAYVHEVAAFVADLRGISFDALAEATTENFFRLFKGAKI